MLFERLCQCNCFAPGVTADALAAGGANGDDVAALMAASTEISADLVVISQAADDVGEARQAIELVRASIRGGGLTDVLAMERTQAETTLREAADRRGCSGSSASAIGLNRRLGGRIGTANAAVVAPVHRERASGRFRLSIGCWT